MKESANSIGGSSRQTSLKPEFLGPLTIGLLPLRYPKQIGKYPEKSAATLSILKLYL